MTLYRLLGALLAAVVLLAVPASAGVVDLKVCSTADKGGTGPCDGATQRANTDQEFAAVSVRAPFVMSIAGTDDLTGCPSPAITSYANGMIAQVTPVADNTGPVRFNWCGVGLLPATSQSGGALGAGDLLTANSYIFKFDGVANQWRSLSLLGTGSSIAANSVTNSKLAQMPANTIKGNNTGATANASDLTASQTTAMLNAFVGDSGSGGTKGLVPAPSSGDAAKFLKADGTWAAPTSSLADGDKGDITVSGSGTTWAVDSGAVAGSEIVNTPAGTIAATTAQAAINELDSEKQAADSDLTTWAGVTPSANAQSLVAAANYAAMRGLLDLEAGTDFYSMAAADSAFISASEIDTSADIRAIIGDETGTGALMFGLTAAMADDLTCTGGHFLRRNAGDTAWECAAIAGGGDALTSGTLAQFAATTSAELAGVLSNETGSGAAVFAASPALTTPDLGTPSAATLTNATGLPIATGVSGLGTGVATALATPSSANLRTAATDEIGTGALMFGLASTMSDDLSCTASQVVRRNSGDTAFECATVSGTGDLVAANNLSDVASAATAFSNIKQAASDTATGVVELATTSEVTTGTDTTRAVTPAGVAAAIAANPGGMQFIGHVSAASTTTQAITGIGEYTSFLFLVQAYSTSTSPNNIRVAFSDNNGSSYSTTHIIAQAAATALKTMSGSTTVSNTKASGSNKVVQPRVAYMTDIDATGSVLQYTTSSTETSVTGIINAIRFDASHSSVSYSVTVFGIP